MEVILLERIEKLGQMGEVVKVKPGYARNYLLPQRKALRATKDNLAAFEGQRAQLEATNMKRREEAEAVAAKLHGTSVSLIRQAGESGQLYGSVTARDISDAVTEAGFTVSRGQVRLDRPIKSLGIHAIRVDLHPEVACSVNVRIAKSAEEASMLTLAEEEELFEEGAAEALWQEPETPAAASRETAVEEAPAANEEAPAAVEEAPAADDEEAEKADK